MSNTSLKSMDHDASLSEEDTLFPMDDLEPLTVKVNIPQVDIAPLFPLCQKFLFHACTKEILNLVSPLTKTLSPKTDLFVKKISGERILHAENT